MCQANCLSTPGSRWRQQDGNRYRLCELGQESGGQRAEGGSVTANCQECLLPTGDFLPLGSPDKPLANNGVFR